MRNELDLRDKISLLRLLNKLENELIEYDFNNLSLKIEFKINNEYLIFDLREKEIIISDKLFHNYDEIIHKDDNRLIYKFIDDIYDYLEDYIEDSISHYE